MTFIDRYNQETTWHGRVLVMEIFHLAQSVGNKWSIAKTAQYFGVSVGLVSENLRLAQAIHCDDKITEIPHRQDALRRLSTYGKSMDSTTKGSIAKLG